MRFESRLRYGIKSSTIILGVVFVIVLILLAILFIEPAL